ncbi:MAG TPA: hypothetical protein VGQ00_02520 [Candidatus Norongarragalinales archaeon]|jgi:hypothetical protein|nr:hypothetical protein [Candidatus Norongarragalinales archaeon]
MTHKYVFLVEDRHKKDLDKVLSEDPYADDSFVKAGAVTRSSTALGLKGGHTVVYFKSEDANIGNRLKERMSKVPTATEVHGSEKDAIVKKIEEEEEAAASGFGSIFG